MRHRQYNPHPSRAHTNTSTTTSTTRGADVTTHTLGCLTSKSTRLLTTQAAEVQTHIALATQAAEVQAREDGGRAMMDIRINKRTQQKGGFVIAEVSNDKVE